MTVCAVFAVSSLGFHLGISFTDPPIAVFANVGGLTVGAVFTIDAVFAVGAVCAIGSVLAVNSVFSVGAVDAVGYSKGRGGSIRKGDRVSIHTVCRSGLFDGDNSVSVDTIFTIGARVTFFSRQAL